MSDNRSKAVIEEHQQISKYDSLNTYTLWIDSTGQEGYVAGDDTFGKNYEFRQRIPDNGSSHIKNAKCRVKFMGMPFFLLDDTNAFGFVNLNIAKNQVSSKEGGFNSRLIAGFSPKVIYRKNRVTTAVPAVVTTGAKIGVGTPATLVGAVNTNTGQVFNSQSNALVTIPVGNSAALSNVTQASYNISDTQLIGQGVIADDLDKGWVPCSNPFGKSLELMISGVNPSAANDAIGSLAGERTVLCLEICLLPDNQANDRFTN